MALLTNAGESYTLSGGQGVGRHNREDLADFITNISPTETPFYSRIGRTKATAVTHEWLTHSLAAASATNVVVEGNEATLITPTTLTRLQNSTQINQKAVAVSGTQDAVNKAGMGKELAYRVILHGKEIKRDLETALLQNTQQVTGATTTARRLNGVMGFVSTNTSSSTVATTASDINSMLQDIWAEGGNPDVMWCNGVTKGIISGLVSDTSTTSYRFNHDVEKKKFTSAVDIWDGDFGVQRVVPDRFDNTLTVKALELQHWKLAQLRPMEIVRLAKTGDTEKRMLQCEVTLESRAENANGVFTRADL